MPKKKLNQLKGETTPFRVERNGQYVLIRNVDDIRKGIFFETHRTLHIGEKLILSWADKLDLAHIVLNNKEAYYGIIYPKQKKFDKKLWNIDLVAQELAEFTKISVIETWGVNSYVMLVRDDEDPDRDKLFSTGFNWEE